MGFEPRTELRRPPRLLNFSIINKMYQCGYYLWLDPQTRQKICYDGNILGDQIEQNSCSLCSWCHKKLHNAKITLIRM